MNPDLWEDEKVQAEETKKERENFMGRLEQAYRGVMSTDDGMVLLRHILDKTDFFASHFTGNARTYYNEGRADIGREIMGEIAGYNPKMFAKICLQGFKRQAHKDKDRK